MSTKKGLGRGLGALLGDTALQMEENAADPARISIYKIEPNPLQPRKQFDELELQALADSITANGLIQPLALRRLPNGYYQIIAGERRWRACRLAGLEEVPAVILEADDQKAMELALIENLQRQDLNPVEEALGYQSLMQDYALTQEQVAQQVGKSRPAIANALRLLNLPKAVTDLVVTGDLSAGHARVLAGLDSEARQLELAHQCVLHGYSVRRLEELTKARPAVRQAAPKREAGPELMALQNAMREALGLKTTLSGTETRGKITLSYNSAQELEHLYEVIGRLLG